jgi:hypothetical protein
MGQQLDSACTTPPVCAAEAEVFPAFLDAASADAIA